MAELNINIRIREMILSGELAPGARVVEAKLSERLNVSRTPIRSALPALAKEGLLKPRGRRGYAVAAYSESDTAAALQLRSVLEALAARHVAARGPSQALVKTLKACLSEGDLIFKKGHVSGEDGPLYSNMNARFHAAIVEAAHVPLLSDMIARANVVPFVAPAAITFDKFGSDRAFRVLNYAHGQHHAILGALLDRDTARAEFLFREHANPQRSGMWDCEQTARVLQETLEGERPARLERPPPYCIP